MLLFSFLPPPRDNNAIPVDLRRVESARSIRIRLWRRDWTGIIFTCVYRSARTYSTRATERTVRARASKSNASANDTGASRSFLRSYVDLAAASVSLPFDRPSLSLSLSLPPFFSYPSILLARAQSYLSSVSVPISDFYLSLSIPLYRSPPPSLLLSFSAPRYFARFKRVTLFFSLSSSMIFFHTYSHSFLLFLSFIPFLSLSLLFSRYISSSQLSSCPCSPPYTSLDRSLSLSFSFYLVSRLTLYLRPAFSLSFIPSLSVRSSQPPPLEFSPFQLPSSPTLSVYTFARFASPAGHPQSSISLSHAHSFSLRLSLSHRFTGVRFAYSLSVSHSLSLSFSLVFRASSIYIFLGRLPSFSLTSASYLGFAETCSRGFRSSPFDPRLLSFNMSRGPFYSSCRRDCRPTTYFVFGNVLARGPGTDRIAY